MLCEPLDAWSARLMLAERSSLSKRTLAALGASLLLLLASPSPLRAQPLIPPRVLELPAIELSPPEPPPPGAQPE
ncbi:MAG: hypothetical protein OEY14_15940, partial [Myxococcales bacterium]|nr:hypothetical protein [Myxococcales bacterium]